MKRHQDSAAAARRRRLDALATGAAIGLLSLGPAFADDTEVFLNQADVRGVRPNILFVIDTSGSMDGLVQVPKAPYDPAVSYGGNCQDSRLYYQRAARGAVPPKATPARPPRASHGPRNTCAAAASALSGRAGLWTGKAAQWDPERVGWRPLRAAAADPLECEADSGTNGPDANSTRRWARDRRRERSLDGTGNRLAVLDGSRRLHAVLANYLNWYNAPDSPTEITRLDVVKSVGAWMIASSVDNLNLGLMRFSASTKTDDFSEGGMVMHEIANLATSRESIVNRLYDFTPDGFTPLSETLYEAGQYPRRSCGQLGLDLDRGVRSALPERAGVTPGGQPGAVQVSGRIPVPTQLRRAAHRWASPLRTRPPTTRLLHCRISAASAARVATVKAKAAASMTWPSI